MIVGIGLDVVEPQRIQRALQEFGAQFKVRVFTAYEIAYCDSKAYPHLHFAARFAAKEALLKALGTGLRAGMQWLDMELRTDDKGKPAFKLFGITNDMVTTLKITHIMVSLTHHRSCAAAVVVLEALDQRQ